jgi:N-acetylglucosaminyldiphosphoundecaprenol N-acetyl-beta-D-mannosaminyltransferase
VTARPRRDGGATNGSRFDVATIRLEGLTFLDLDEQAFVELVVSEARAGRGGWVVTPNADIMRQAREDEAIHTLLESADALVADGMPLIWASFLQNTPLRGGRVCGSDLIVSLPAAAARADLSVYLLGGAGDTAARTAEILTRDNPALRIVGTYSPPFGFERDREQIDEMRRLVADAQPDVVFVALSFPKGERLIQQIRGARPNAWWLGVGAAFDFVSGDIHRAPGWMQATGTEWMFRLVQSPKRLTSRYLLHDVPYVLLLLGGSLRRRFGVP